MSQYVVRARDLDQIAWELFRELQIDLISWLGDDAGMGWVKAGDCRIQDPVYLNRSMTVPETLHDVSEWVFPNTDTPPPADSCPNDQPQTDVHVGSGPVLYRLFSFAKGSEIVREHARAFGTRLMGYARQRAALALGSSKGGAYIWKAVEKRIPGMVNRYGKQAVEKLAGVALKRKKRSGVQQISTRREDLPAQGFFKFSGCWAYRQHTGRPALPAGVWMERYRARKAKRRKTNKRRRPGNRVKTPPPTKYPRPKRIVGLAKRKGTVKPFTAPHETDTVFDSLGPWQEIMDTVTTTD
jgi:hypothetical protein